MLRSMTGYGEGVAEDDRFVITIEIRSVNNRFLKITPKVPEEYSFLQNDLERRIRGSILRGTIHVTLRVKPRDTSEFYEIDREVVKKYLRSLELLKNDLNREADSLSLRDLLLLPGVVRGEESLIPDKDSIHPVVRKVVDQALSQLRSMRELEGSHLEKDLRHRAKELEKHLENLGEEAPRAVEEYQKKLDQRVRKLLGDHEGALGPEDILKEVAIVAERSDITEEIARMESHINQFFETLNDNSPVGRKLEFIVQEMFREANTMSSKSTSSTLTREIVHLKAEVDRMKEQVVNIE